MPALSPGARLGAYEVIDLLGAGGMGEVYRAQDTKLGRDVALKILPDAFADDLDRLPRFKREAKALAALNHPHIAALYGMEEADGRHFLVMELVDGETLADRLSRGPMPRRRRAPCIATQIAEALEAAHEKGIVHRDLKPANIKITRGREGQGARFRPGEAWRRRRKRRGDTCRRCPDAFADAQHDGDAGRRHPRHGGVHVAGAGRRACRPINEAMCSRSAACSSRC